jgi:hypothetical protein
MITNVTKYAVKFLESGSIEVILQSSNREAIASKSIESGDKYNDNQYPMSVIITDNELPLFLACMKGESNFYPYFSDISYLLRVYPDGFSYIKLSGMNDGISGKYSESTFTFPNKLLPHLHRLITLHMESPSSEIYEIPSHEIQAFSDMVKPCFEWHYNHQTRGKWEHYAIGDPAIWHEWIEKDITVSLKNWGEKYPKLNENLESLERIAANYSVYGERILIDISFDSYNTDDTIPDSFYFNIHNEEGQRIMNGGIIFHPDYREEDRTIGSYSIHT